MNEKLVVDNMNLVHYIINKYYPSLRGDEDLIQVGMIGLCKAAEKWDSERSKFSTYASVCIRNEIRDELKKRKKNIKAISLQLKSKEDETVTLEEVISKNSDVDSCEDLYNFYHSLTPIEQRVWDLFSYGSTVNEIAETLQQTPTNVRTIRRKIKYKWREFYEKD